MSHSGFNFYGIIFLSLTIIYDSMSSDTYDQITYSENNNGITIMTKVIFRLVILAAIVYLATTYIPQPPLPFNFKLTITAIVVLIYAVIDIIVSLIIAFKNELCRWFCSC
jgi:hypothetical protein